MIDFPERWLGEDSLTVELARRDLEHESSEHYNGFVVRSRFKRVLNEAVKMNATAHGEEVRRFPNRYIDSVKTPDGRMLRSNCKMRDAFRAHFHDRFARCPDLLQEFRSYLADITALGRLKRLVARVWLLNAKSVTRWSRLASTSHQD